MESEAFRRVLADERLRTARLYNSYRFAGISAFFVLVLVMRGVVRNPAWAPDLTLFVAYWVTSGAMWAWAQRSDLGARLAGLAIPFVDMPIVLVLHLTALSRADPGFVVGSTTGFYVLLIIGATVALDTQEIFAAAAMAVVLQGVLQVRAESGAGIMAFTTLMLVLATLGCTHVVRRVRHLAGGVAAEQLRLERLGRYFSPEVAAMLAAAPERGPAAESREDAPVRRPAGVHDARRTARELRGRGAPQRLSRAHGTTDLRAGRHARQVPGRRPDGLLRGARVAA